MLLSVLETPDPKLPNCYEVVLQSRGVPRLGSSPITFFVFTKVPTVFNILVTPYELLKFSGSHESL